jgi:hypothetical protein
MQNLIAVTSGFLKPLVWIGERVPLEHLHERNLTIQPSNFIHANALKSALASDQHLNLNNQD